MPKVAGPLLSKKASGKFAGTLVFSSWRGISYVREYCRPKVKGSKRLQRVNELFGQQTKRWGALPERCRQAWERFVALLDTKASPHTIFGVYSALALDVGFPEPVLPPKPRKLAPPRLSLRLDEEAKSLSLSWKTSRLPAKGVVDIYFCACKASHHAHPHFHHHLTFAPVIQKVYVMRDLLPNQRYSFRARLILPDSSHSDFSSASLVYEAPQTIPKG